MKNNIKSIVFASILLLLIAVAPILVKAEVVNSDVSNGSDDTSSETVTNGGVSNGDDDISGITSQTSNGDDDTGTANSLNQGGSNQNTNSDTLNGGDDTGGTATPVTPEPPVTPPDNNGGNTSRGSSGSVGGSSGSVGGSVLISGNLPTISNIGQCSYLTEYLKIGGDNSVSEVNKLQLFLKDTEKLDVEITGIFDQKTFDAVKAFQGKYLTDIMGPWGSSVTTGQVFFTTEKKINEIYCKKNFDLTPEQLSQIEAYKNAIANGENPTIGSTVGTENITASTSISLGGEESVGTSTDQSQTAAAGNTSFFGKIWKFVKRIFGR